MVDPLLVLLHDLAASVGLLLGTSTLTTVLVLVGATALAAATAALVARGARALLLVVPAGAVHPVRGARDVLPVVAQSDPDAPGRVRPRAPGLLLG
ncbi:DUF6412 domain-containing protein [Cellulomonas triticagri]|uniref:Uncharacterized protein n=1 Tax=Cellulomonas triticagri TaxID=2483352 RepID=A0A3M2JIH6_9CELL|nr:DUF6412 domain-containing protein [Cellulomonas triticagri]RMI12884.1 hypothetical protein EBM89_06850 [Cellulomonas triticagri]